MSNVAEAVATLTKVLGEQPEKAQTKNVPAVAVLHEGLKSRKRTALRSGTDERIRSRNPVARSRSTAQHP